MISPAFLWRAYVIAAVRLQHRDKRFVPYPIQIFVEAVEQHWEKFLTVLLFLIVELLLEISNYSFEVEGSHWVFLIHPKVLKQLGITNSKFSLGAKWVEDIKFVFKCALKEVVRQRNNMWKTLQRTWEVAAVIDVADAGETELSILLWLACPFPLFNVVKTKACFVVEDLVILHAHLAAVKHFVAPFAAEVNTLIWKILAVTAFAVNVRLHCRRQRYAKHAFVVTKINSELVIFVYYVLH